VPDQAMESNRVPTYPTELRDQWQFTVPKPPEIATTGKLLGALSVIDKILPRAKGALF